MIRLNARMITGLTLFASTMLALLVTPPASASTEQRIALVIGNANYAEAPLRNPANDARAIAASLRARGFEVMVRENANKQQMESAVADFGEKLTEGATALFFYAGHGMQVNGRNYLIPSNARITTEQRVRVEAVDVDLVLEQMQAARAKVSMVILDACRNNPFERRFRSTGGGLAQINAPAGTLIAYATAPGKVAADGVEGANGLYTQELLKALNEPGLRVEDVFKQVRINVGRASNGQQVPWEASSLTRDFYFVPPVAAAPAAATTAAPADPSPQIEIAFWDTVKNSTNPAEFRAYIDKYPNGSFTPLAKAKLEALLNPRIAIVSSAGGTSSRFDGRYSAELKSPRGPINAVLDIAGAAISGFSIVEDRAGGGRNSLGWAGLCRITGALDAEGTVQRLHIECPSFSGTFAGRVLIDPATGQASVDTTVSGPSWNSARVIWKRN